LSVLPKGTLTAYTGYAFDGLSFSDKLTIIIPIAFILLLILFIVILLRLRKKNAKLKRKRKNKKENINIQHSSIVNDSHNRPNISNSSGIVDLSRNKKK
jgi:uncharacterized membrane protein